MKSNESIPRITIKEISHIEFNSLIKELSDEALDRFKAGFDEEKVKMEALPPDKRIYYLILLNDNSHLLVGINPNPLPDTINISSLARIPEKPKRKAATCLKKLIEDELVHMCKKKEKKHIVALARERGIEVFEAFIKDIPKGVKEVSRYDKGKINNKRMCSFLFLVAL